MCHYLSQLSHTVTHNYLTIPDGALLGDGIMEEALNQQTHKMTIVVILLTYVMWYLLLNEILTTKVFGYVKV